MARYRCFLRTARNKGMKFQNGDQNNFNYFTCSQYGTQIAITLKKKSNTQYQSKYQNAIFSVKLGRA